MRKQALLVFAVFFTIVTLAYAQSTVNGKWEDSKDSKSRMEFKVDGKIVTGTVTRGGVPFPIHDGKVISADTISFGWTTAFPPEGNPISYTATGQLSGSDQMTLAVAYTIESTQVKGEESIRLKRAK